MTLQATALQEVAKAKARINRQNRAHFSIQAAAERQPPFFLKKIAEKRSQRIEQAIFLSPFQDAN
jgi:hypothetical protein